MRGEELFEHVQGLIEGYWSREPEVAQSVVECEAFETFARLLNRAADGDQNGIAECVADVAESLSEDQLDWMAGQGTTDPPEKPAAFLAAKLNELTT